ncbi:MAG: ATP-binding protein [Polyangiaceae bacterium]|nr:ATP-binding protein [Polyangiaceae bacterium]
MPSQPPSNPKNEKLAASGSKSESSKDISEPSPGSFQGTSVLQAFESSQALPAYVRRWRVILGSSLVLLILGVMIGAWYSVERELHRSLAQRLNETRSANTQALQQTLALRLSVAGALQKNANLKRAILILSSPPQEAFEREKQDLEKRLSAWKESNIFDEWVLLDDGAQALLSSSPSIRIKNNESLEQFLVERRQLFQAQKPLLFTPSQTSRFFEKERFLIFVPANSSINSAGILLFPSDAPLEESLEVALPTKNARTAAYLSTGGQVYPRAAQAETTESTTSSPSSGKEPSLPLSATSSKRMQQGELFLNTDGYETDSGNMVVGSGAWNADWQLAIVSEIPLREASAAPRSLKRVFIVVCFMVAGALVGFLLLGRWTLRVRSEAILAGQRLSRLTRAIQPLSAALEHDPSAVLLSDAEGAIVYANATSHEILNRHEPIIGLPLVDAFKNMPPQIQDALESGGESIVTMRGDEKRETLLVSSKTIRIDRKQHFLFLIRPITAQVRRSEVENWKKLIRVFSHEINNSLAPISSLVSSGRKLNKKGANDIKLEKLFETIAERTSHLASFLESYREIARLPMPTRREVIWGDFIESLQRQLKFEIHGKLPEEPAYIDPVQMERVLLNLLKNALEVGPPDRPPSLTVVKGQKTIKIQVADRGPGMSEKVLEQAMLPFFSTKEGGTGIGLALSREILEAHEGILTLANRDDGGLLVTCHLPVTQPSSAELPRLTTKENAQNPHRAINKPGARSSHLDKTLASKA